MKLKGFHQFLNESEEFKPLKIEENDPHYSPGNSSTDGNVIPPGNEEYEALIKKDDVDWTNVVKESFPDMEDTILRSMNSLQWEPVEGQSIPGVSGLNLKSAIKEFKIPKVDMIAYQGEPRTDWIFGTKEEPGAAYTVTAVQGNYKNGTYRIFFIDGGDVLTPIGGVKVDETEIPESNDPDIHMDLDAMYKKMVKFLERFPDNATDWSKATDEIRDMARSAREIHTELDLDMLHDEWERNPKAPQPLDFTKLKTPAEWNTEGKKYIIDTVNKMGDWAKQHFFEDFKHWFK